MVGACLFLRTLVNLNRVDTGFNKENVLRLDIDSAVTGYKEEDPRLKVLFKQIEERVNALPGVQAASFSAFTFNEGSWNSAIRVPGMPVDRKVNVSHNIIGDAYFKAMQIPHSRGPQLRPAGYSHLAASGDHQRAHGAESIPGRFADRTHLLHWHG